MYVDKMWYAVVEAQLSEWRMRAAILRAAGKSDVAVAVEHCAEDIEFLISDTLMLPPDEMARFAEELPDFTAHVSALRETTSPR